MRREGRDRALRIVPARKGKPSPVSQIKGAADVLSGWRCERYERNAEALRSLAKGEKLAQAALGGVAQGRLEGRGVMNVASAELAVDELQRMRVSQFDVRRIIAVRNLSVPVDQEHPVVDLVQGGESPVLVRGVHTYGTWRLAV